MVTSELDSQSGDSPEPLPPADVHTSKPLVPSVFVWLLALLAVLGIYLSKLFAFFTALPIFYIALLQGAFSGGLLLVAAGIVLFQVNPLDALFLYVASGGAALMMASNLRRGKALTLSMARGVLFTAVLLVLVLVSVKGFDLGTHWPWVGNLHEQLTDNLNTFYTQWDELLEKTQKEPRSKLERTQGRALFLTWSLAVLPGVIIALTAISLWIFLVLMRPRMGRLGFADRYGDWLAWQSPEYLIWGPILALSALILKVGAFKVLAVNALIVFATVYLFQGIAVLTHFLKVRKFPALGRLMLYLLALVFLKQMVFLLVGAGFFDVWFDFRKLNVQKAES